MNQRSGTPPTRSANSTPLRLIAVTTVEPGTPWAASAATLQAVSVRLRNEWLLPPMNSSTRRIVSLLASVASRSGASRRWRRSVHAALRACTSSPICVPSATILKTSMPPSLSRSAAASVGPSTSRIQRSRSMVAWS
jgi:hypothetical protein